METEGSKSIPCSDAIIDNCNITLQTTAHHNQISLI